MPDFPFKPDGYTASVNWRPLRRKDPMQKGWDVFDWQCRLRLLGSNLICDGWFGDQTAKATRAYQRLDDELVEDGIAGAASQVASGIAVASDFPGPGDMDLRVQGQIQKESSYLCGVYTAPYTNGSIDRGPAQENSKYHPDNAAAFDVRKTIPKLVAAIKSKHAGFVAAGVGDKLAWASAQGAWNNPTYAIRYSKCESNVPDSFRAYVAAVTAYVP